MSLNYQQGKHCYSDEVVISILESDESESKIGNVSEISISAATVISLKSLFPSLI